LQLYVAKVNNIFEKHFFFLKKYMKNMKLLLDLYHFIVFFLNLQQAMQIDA